MDWGERYGNGRGISVGINYNQKGLINCFGVRSSHYPYSLLPKKYVAHNARKLLYNRYILQNATPKYLNSWFDSPTPIIQPDMI